MNECIICVRQTAWSTGCKWLKRRRYENVYDLLTMCSLFTSKPEMAKCCDAFSCWVQNKMFDGSNNKTVLLHADCDRETMQSNIYADVV